MSDLRPDDRAGTTFRALVVHARTLEFYRQMGLSEPLLREVLKFERPGREQARFHPRGPRARPPWPFAWRPRPDGEAAAKRGDADREARFAPAGL